MLGGGGGALMGGGGGAMVGGGERQRWRGRGNDGQHTCGCPHTMCTPPHTHPPHTLNQQPTGSLDSCFQPCGELASRHGRT